MANCATCRQKLEVPFDFSPDHYYSGCCSNCGSRLRAVLRLRFTVLAFGAVVGALLKLITMPFNPRVNLQKLAKFPFLLEAMLVRLFWRTGLVKTELFSPPDACPSSESFRKAS